MLSCGAMCLAIYWNISILPAQLYPSHQSVGEGGLVTTEKSGTWHYYDLNKNAFEKFKADTAELTADTPACICEPVRSKAVCVQ